MMRHWKERFDADAEYVYSGPMRVSVDGETKMMKRGAKVRKELFRSHTLKALWLRDRIAKKGELPPAYKGQGTKVHNTPEMRERIALERAMGKIVEAEVPAAPPAEEAPVEAPVPDVVTEVEVEEGE